MSTPLRDLISAILPNLSSRDMRAMIPWFEAVSDVINQSASIVAMANVDAGGTLIKNIGFNSPVLHPGTGQFALNLTNTTYDINTLIPFANVTNVGTPGGAINIYPAMTTGSQVFLNLWQIAVTTAARTAVDAEFMVLIAKFPADI